jgi:hypothetical protein
MKLKEKTWLILVDKGFLLFSRFRCQGAAAHGCNVLATHKLETIGEMSCNPATCL